ncbi:phosphate ABC transporter permease PstA [Alginatibacterium sediminis]|uniref:Phosphate transport system permease protein PstA n=1 Tax=Alginatibacterium sediminis TaxID=2164068 RepID=A0A420E9U4_9ALTE|nr:phosphate ABC transporter permease PstA [Alginatibacterium sediminis]RKF17448.1 phosphate ABC transporter permease PstA [Alginatibacterium sediminis]
MNKWFKSGAPWIWMTAGAVSISLVAVVGLLILIAVRGLSYFWPSEVYEFDLSIVGQQTTVIGEIYDKELVPLQRLQESGADVSGLDGEFVERLLLKTGNREYVDLDFRWITENQILSQKVPENIAVLERRTNGNFYGYIEAVVIDGEQLKSRDDHQQVFDSIRRSNDLIDEADSLQKSEIGSVNYRLERIRLKQRKLELEHALTTDMISDFDAQREVLHQEYLVYEKSLFALRDQAARDSLIVRDMRGELVTIPLNNILDIHFPNEMGVIAKSGHWLHQIYKFVSSEPREANTEGGVFPAIFGTVFMVMLMAVIVTPLGVVAAIYLHEYAANNSFTKLIRIAVINLAGVPSIVYGVFGLGFFVYMMGGSIDQLFYPESLPSPTFGSPGVIWSALTLAILTLPVVIVSTEEGLSRIPSSVREGSLALGATKAETLWRIVIPMASPAIMTGLILAVARAAGEVAPLMLVGVVKLAPTLPLDGNFPFIHLERKFMHLGFHIYDVGFQSPNVEAARPLVYATSFLLVTVIVGLNLAAIQIRNKLREKYKTLEQ